MLFLSTSHRGTNLALILNRILTISVFGHSVKQFISELENDSITIQDINEQFRSFAPRLAIFSFYETLKTTAGPTKIMVLEKESSVLGYPSKISKPLNADHHDVCKFTGREDPNYLNFRNALSILLEQIRLNDAEASESRYAKEHRKTHTHLSMFTDSTEDYEFHF